MRCCWTAFLLSSSSFSPGQTPSPEPDRSHTFWLVSELREPQGAPVTLQPLDLAVTTVLSSPCQAASPLPAQRMDGQRPRSTSSCKALMMVRKLPGLSMGSAPEPCGLE